MVSISICIDTIKLSYLRSNIYYNLEVISYLTKAVARGERAELAGAGAARRHVEFLDAATLPTLERRDKVKFRGLKLSPFRGRIMTEKGIVSRCTVDNERR